MSFSNSDTIQNLQDAANAFNDHEGISVENIRRWSAQFGGQNQQLALKILKNINYYSGTTIRRMVEDLLKSVCNHLQLSDRRKIIFVPIGEPYEGSAIIARALRSTKGINRHQIKFQRDLVDVPKRTNIRAIVLLDVFTGTGKQLYDWWRNMETLLLPWAEKSINLIIGILGMNYKALELLKNIPAEKIHVSYFDIKYNVLSKQSKVFLDPEKKIIKKFCRETNCDREYLYGKGECGLLVAFKHGCPNNSLPILWYESNRWKRIFRRRAL